MATEVLSASAVVVGASAPDQTAAIDLVGSILVAEGCVKTCLRGFFCGFERAVKGTTDVAEFGLDVFTGDAVAIMMADLSDDPDDLVRYYKLLEAGYDCAFGSRFVRGATVRDYPRFKLFLNRLANAWIRLIFRHGYNDTTNAFKAYRRTVIDGCRPLMAPHFNLTVEIPLKAIVRGFTWTVTPISWQNRKHGVAKLKLKEMGSRYFFICAYVWLEKYFSRGDYRRK